MSTSRIFNSGVRAVARQAARVPTSRQSAMRSVARRGYASGGHPGSAGAEKTSDMPWLIGSVGFTIPALAWLYSGPSKKPAAYGSSHGSSHAESSDHESESESESESGAETPESSDSESESSDSKPEPETPPPTPSSDSDSASKPEPETKPAIENSKLPPPPADNTDMSVDPEGKKASYEDYKQMIRDKDTKKATSSSDLPSKRTAGEHPREDPQGGEGEAVKKGGPE